MVWGQPRIAQWIGVKVRGTLRPPYRRLALALACTASKNLQGRVALVAPPPIAEILVSNGCFRSWTACGEGKEKTIVVLWCNEDYSSKGFNVVFAASAPIRELATIRAKYLGNERYLVSYMGFEEIVRVHGFDIYADSPPKESLAALLRHLCRHVSETGILSVQETVELLSHELGYRKGELRKLMIDLVKRGYIVVEKGHIIKIRYRC